MLSHGGFVMGTSPRRVDLGFKPIMNIQGYIRNHWHQPAGGRYGRAWCSRQAYSDLGVATFRVLCIRSHLTYLFQCERAAFLIVPRLSDMPDPTWTCLKSGVGTG